MRPVSKAFCCAIAALAMAMVAGCSQTDAPPAKILSPEESLECASLLFAVNNLMDVDGNDADAVAVKDGALAAITRLGTVYANAKGISGSEFIGLIKIKAYRMLGKVPGGDTLSESTIVRRAKACIS